MVIVSFGLLHSRIEYQPTLFLEGRSLGHCVLELSCEFGGVVVNLDIFIYFWVLSFYRQPIIMWPVRTTQLACNLRLLLLKYLGTYLGIYSPSQDTSVNHTTTTTYWLQRYTKTNIHPSLVWQSPVNPAAILQTPRFFDIA